jgi:hypothetical protein
MPCAREFDTDFKFNDMAKFKIAPFRPELFLLLVSLVAAFTLGCQAVRYKSRLMSQKEAEGKSFTKSAAEVRLYLDDLAGVFAGTIEQAADRILKESAETDIRRHALLWKINGIPAVYRALFQPDPAVAIIDGWAFSIQMVDYFESGNGKNQFGRWQPVALDASNKLESKVRQIIAGTLPEGGIHPLKEKIQSWASDHPIEGDFIYRDTTAPELARIIGDQAMDTLQTVGSLAVGIEELADQLTTYLNLLSKQARWQVELVAAEASNPPELQRALKTAIEITRSLNQLVSLAEQSPAMVARERETIFKSLQQEREELLTKIDQQRRATLASLKQERMAIVDALHSERQTIMENIQLEREVTLRSIDEMRQTAYTDLESAGNRMLKNARSQSERLIDYLFIRGLLFLFAGLFGGLVLVIVWLRVKGRDRTGFD